MSGILYESFHHALIMLCPGKSSGTSHSEMGQTLPSQPSLSEIFLFVFSVPGALTSDTPLTGMVVQYYIPEDAKWR